MDIRVNLVVSMDNTVFDAIKQLSGLRQQEIVEVKAFGPEKPKAAKKQSTKKEADKGVTNWDSLGKAEKLPAKDAEKPAEPAKASVDDIRGFLGNILRDQPQMHDRILKVFEKYGAKTISQLPVDKLNEVFADLEKEVDK